MIYKATFKDYFITGLSCGAVYGIVMYLMKFSALGAIFGAVTFGFLFPAVLSLFGKNTEDRAKLVRQMLAQTHHITCDGVAKLKDKPGWMFLCEDALVYYPNNAPQPLVLPLAQIRNVDLSLNRLIIHTQSGTFKFIVCQNQKWQASILQSVDMIHA